MLIATIAIVLALATLVESRYGTPAVQFAVYQSTWFAVLLAILAVNVLAAVLVRFPWQRKQIGFIIVHFGILVLLLGCWISREKGTTANMILYEGDTQSEAVTNRREFVLVVSPTRQAAADRASKTPKSDSPDETADSIDQSTARLIEIPFHPGPFNWSDYDTLWRFPWHWGRRDRGVLYDHDGVRLEVLDYLNDSRRVTVPELKLRLPEPATLTVREMRIPHMPGRSLIVGSQARLAVKTTFQMATSQAATEAFRNSRPEGPLGPLGQIVLYTKGKKYPISVKELLDKNSVPLCDSGVHVKLIKLEPDSLRIWLETHVEGKDNSDSLLLLSATHIEIDQQDTKNDVFGVYWFAPSEQPNKEADKKEVQKINSNKLPVVPEAAAVAAAEPRVDILQGNDENLYYRTWRDGRVGKIGRLPVDGSTVVVFKDSDSPVDFAVESFIPAAKPGWRVVPVEFDKDKTVRQERVLVRLTVDGKSREFWLASPFVDDPTERFGGVHGDNRVAMLRFERPTVDLGFKVHLRDFTCEYDPGTTRKSHYESHVDFLTNDKQARPLKENVSLKPNHPAPCTDPVSGRTFRIFQTRSFEGPFAPEQVAPQSGQTNFDRDRIFQTVLIVAHDPGRQLKYAGCIMIMAGIMVMYYMKAYFFQRREKPETKN